VASPGGEENEFRQDEIVNCRTLLLPTGACAYSVANR
jgi:hypothetical protein